MTRWPIIPLFVLCIKALSTLLQHAKSCGLIKGGRVCLGAPLITHLFFANDCLIFYQATYAANECIKHLLHLYEIVFCQKYNLDKTKLQKC